MVARNAFGSKSRLFLAGAREAIVFLVALISRAKLEGLSGTLHTENIAVRAHARLDASFKQRNFLSVSHDSCLERSKLLSIRFVSRIGLEAFAKSMENKNLQIVQSGERTNTTGKPVSNIILRSSSDSDYGSIRPHLEYVDLPNHLVLQEAGGKLEFVYFPNQGLISLVVVMKDGRTAETGIVGNEGFTGTPASVGLSRSPLRAIVQITGDGFRVKVGVLQSTLESTPRFQLMLGRYAVLQGMQVAQTAACNRLHGIEQRLARWLLMTQDRVDSEKLPITHDFLATMLGTDRPSVSLAAGILQKRHLIEYTRGAVKIVNRKKLEDSACECYGVTQQYNGELGLK